MSNCEKFWEPLLYDEKFVGVSSQELNDLEIHLGKTLPNLFKDVYEISNGGIAHVSEIHVPEYEHEPDYVPFWIHKFLTIQEIKDFNSSAETIPENVVAFAEDLSSWIGFDYRVNTTNPHVIYYDHFTNKIYKLGDSFEVFFAE